MFPSTLPNIETPYPMLVLVGPQGSGKKDLAMKLVDEFGDYFGYGSVDTFSFITANFSSLGYIFSTSQRYSR